MRTDRGDELGHSEWRMLARTRSVVAVAVLFSSAAAAQDPTVVALDPANGSSAVRPGAWRLRIAFDRDMDTAAGHSMALDLTGLPFPPLAGESMWVDARTLLVPVDLAAGTEYGCVLNGEGTEQRFRDAAGHRLGAVEWRFATSPSPPPAGDAAALRRAANERAFDELRRAIDERYSYRDRTQVDWPARFATARDPLLAATTDGEWVEHAAKLLAPAADPHLWLQIGDRIVPTHRREVAVDFNPRLLPRLLPAVQQVNRNVLQARTEDGIGYVAIATFDRKARADIAAAHEVLAALRDGRALIVDVRPNSGGDEQLAREVAAWFATSRKVYAGHRIVDRARPEGFGPVQQRSFVGNDAGERRFEGPVAVLMGPRNISSCEAFLLMMRQCEQATLIGARSAGSSGNPQPIRLGDGIVIMVPCWQALRPDGTGFEGEGIEPDVAVEATEDQLRTADPVLQRALEVLRERLRARR